MNTLATILTSADASRLARRLALANFAALVATACALVALAA